MQLQHMFQTQGYFFWVFLFMITYSSQFSIVAFSNKMSNFLSSFWIQGLFLEQKQIRNNNNSYNYHKRIGNYCCTLWFFSCSKKQRIWPLNKVTKFLQRLPKNSLGQKVAFLLFYFWQENSFWPPSNRFINHNNHEVRTWIGMWIKGLD